jgi:hypothetical protein
MHQTTLRFSANLWSALEQEAARTGVSVAQYVREAALARVAFAAGRRGQYDFVQALDADQAAPHETATTRAQELRVRLAAPNVTAGDDTEDADTLPGPDSP